MENSKIQSEINSVKEQIKERGVFIQSLQDQIDEELLIQKLKRTELKGLEKAHAASVAKQAGKALNKLGSAVESSLDTLKDISKNGVR